MPQPRTQPPPLVLFSLKPLNDRARHVVATNRHLASISSDGRTQVLDIGIYSPKVLGRTLATIGRANADITVNEPTISRLQCSFEMDHLKSGVVMLYDRSCSRTTKPLGAEAIQFDPDNPRRIVVAPGVNTLVGMGGPKCDLIIFELKWRKIEDKVFKDMRSDALSGPDKHQCLVRTADEGARSSPAQHAIAVRATKKPIRYVIRRHTPVGSGAFGDVFKAIDVDCGKLFALKEQSLGKQVQREPNIVDLHAANLEPTGAPALILMGFKDGTLGELIEAKYCENTYFPLLNRMFDHIIHALDYLARSNIVHRDVKPDNILYTESSTGEYTFQLADFGLSNIASHASSPVGTPMFRAPEILFHQREPHTSKVDVWSLFVTMAYAMNVDDYWLKRFKNPHECIKAVLVAAKDSRLSHIKDMAEVKADQRPSAADLLMRLYGEQTLSHHISTVNPVRKHQLPYLHLGVRGMCEVGEIL